MFGNMIPGMAGPAIIGLFGENTSTGYMITGVGCAIVGFVICLLHYFYTEERTSVYEENKADDIKISDILDVIKKNRAFVQEHGFDSIDFIHNSAVVVEDTAICGTRGWFAPENQKSAHDKKVYAREISRLRASLEAAKKTGREQSLTGHIIIFSGHIATFHPKLSLLPAIFSYFCPET